MYTYFCKLNRLFALLLLILLSPLLLVVSILIFFFIDKKVFYIQRRVGHLQKIFNCYKFSSMLGNGDSHRSKPSDQETDRINLLGKFFREFHIDEIPQLLNIIKGDINFIGPRPHEVWHDEHYKERLQDHKYLLKNYSKRNYIKPGLTGLAQCLGYNGAIDDKQLAQRIRYDLLYLRKKNFLLNLFIIFKTLKLIIFKKNEK